MQARRIARGVVALAGGWMVACSGVNPNGAPPSEARPVIDHPANHHIFFRDEERKHVVSLHPDGSYVFKSGTDLGGVLSTRDGRWSWKKTGTHTAELALDADEWKLTFADPDSAIAVNLAATGRTYAFQFEEM